MMRLTNFCCCMSHDAGILIFQFIWNLTSICLWFATVVSLSLALDSLETKVILNLLFLREIVRFT